jgi:hypothetical protein
MLSFAGIGCAGQPAAPFDTLKTSNVTAFRLQNYEAPEAAAATPGAPGGIPGIPPEIQQWIQQGAQGLQALIPPGLLPPGLVPGTPGAPVATSVPRFHNFRILGQTQVMDEDLKEELGKLFGDEDNFDNANARCPAGTIYAEMGLSFSGGPGGASNDMLVSFSCSQAVSRSFSWPHKDTGMKPKTVQKLTDIVQQLWPQGA